MRNAFLVARREYVAYVTAWGFWLGLLLTPLGLSVGLLIPSLVESTTPARYFTVIDETGTYSAAVRDQLDRVREAQALGMLRAAHAVNGETAQDEAVDRFRLARVHGATVNEALRDTAPDGIPLSAPGYDYLFVDPPGDTIDALSPYLLGEQLVDGPFGPRPLYAALIYRPGEEIEYWSEDLVSIDLPGTASNASRFLAQSDYLRARGVEPAAVRYAERDALKVVERSPTSGSGDGGKVTFADRAPFFAALALSFMLWLLIFSVVNFLLTGTIEERSNKIFDALLTSVSLPQLLTGKLFGVLMLSLTLVGIWGGLGLVSTLAIGRDLPEEAVSILEAVGNPRLVVPALISFVLGYLMYGAVFLALGSLCDTIQEAQSLMSPVIIIMLLPLLMLPISIANPSSPIIGILSWVPLFTPFLLILRVPAEPPLWELGGSILFMVAFTAMVLWICTRIYRAGAVHGAGMSDVRGWFGGWLPGRSRTRS